MNLKPLCLALALTLPAGFSSGCGQLLAATHEKPIELDPGQRTRGEIIDDRQIETLLKINFDKLDPRIKSSTVTVNSYNGVVLLTGQVPGQQLRELVGTTAAELKTVRQVHNQVEVASTPTIYSKINDEWLSTKITAQIVNKRIVEANRVKIIVYNREAYIMGLLTENEAQQVTEIARGTSGIERVVRAVEIVPDHERAPF